MVSRKSSEVSGEGFCLNDVRSLRGCEGRHGWVVSIEVGVELLGLLVWM